MRTREITKIDRPPGVRVLHVVLLLALGLSLAFQLLGLIPGPLIGVLALILGGARVQFANVVSSFLYVIFFPISVIGLTMAYHRVKDEIVEPEMRT